MIASGRSIMPNGYIEGATIMVVVLNAMPKAAPHSFMNHIAYPAINLDTP